MTFTEYIYTNYIVSITEEVYNFHFFHLDAAGHKIYEFYCSPCNLKETKQKKHQVLYMRLLSADRPKALLAPFASAHLCVVDFLPLGIGRFELVIKGF